jgi:hypothetical protein
MSPTGNGDPRYRVTTPGAALAAIREIHRRARELGVAPAVLAALRTINRRLQDEPTTFGEPLYPLTTLQLYVRHAAVRPLSVTYGVHQQRPLVIVLQMHLMWVPGA